MNETNLRALALLFTFGAAACAEDPKPEQPPIIIDEPDEAPDLLNPEDMEADLAAPDMSAPDMDVEDMAPTAACPSAITWSAGLELPGVARDHHVTFITTRGAPRLHVVGGNTYRGVLADHWSAPILDGGALGFWGKEAALPAGGAGQALAQVGDDIYLLGGRDTRQLKATVLRAVFDAQGVITGWQEERALPEARFHSSAAVHGRTIYVSGGVQADGAVQASLYRATAAEDGTLGEWEALELPQPRSHHSSFVLDDHLYMALGIEGNPFNNQTTDHLNVMRAPLSAAGVGEWEIVATAQRGLSTHATTLINRCALTVGGLLLVGGLPSYRSAVIPLDLDAPGLDAQLEPLVTGRSHMHQAPHHAGFIYVVGGSAGYQQVVKTVEIGALSAP